MNFTEAQLEVVKHVMFGLQKQSSVINDAVVKIVANVNCNLGDIMADEDSFRDAVVRVLQRAIDYCDVDDNLVMLIAGEQSLANSKEPGPKIVQFSKLSDDSPKYNFRIVRLENSTIDTSYTVAQAVETPIEVTPADYNAVSSKEESYRDKVEKLKNDILPLVPEAVKAELGTDNEYMLCLCISDYYFNL